MSASADGGDGTATRRPGAGARVVALLVEPAVPVLVLAALTQVMRRAWLDCAVFLAGAVAIGWDRRRWRGAAPPPAPRRWPVTTLALLAAGAVVTGLAVGQLPRGGGVASALLGVPGVVAAVAVLRRPARGSAPRGAPSGRASERPGSEPLGPPEPPGSEPLGPPGPWRYAWLAVFLALAVAELSAFLSQTAPRVDNPERPTLSTIVEPLLDNPVVRGLAIAAWLLVGVWLVRRIRAWMRRAVGDDRMPGEDRAAGDRPSAGGAS